MTKYFYLFCMVIHLYLKQIENSASVYDKERAAQALKVKLRSGTDVETKHTYHLAVSCVHTNHITGHVS